jgi:hypothetical protein
MKARHNAYKHTASILKRSSMRDPQFIYLFTFLLVNERLQSCTLISSQNRYS